MRGMRGSFWCGEGASAPCTMYLMLDAVRRCRCSHSSHGRLYGVWSMEYGVWSINERWRFRMKRLCFVLCVCCVLCVVSLNSYSTENKFHRLRVYDGIHYFDRSVHCWWRLVIFKGTYHLRRHDFSNSFHNRDKRFIIHCQHLYRDNETTPWFVMKLASLCVFILVDALFHVSLIQATINDEMLAMAEMAETIPGLKTLSCNENRGKRISWRLMPMKLFSALFAAERSLFHHRYYSHQ